MTKSFKHKTGFTRDYGYAVRTGICNRAALPCLNMTLGGKGTSPGVLQSSVRAPSFYAVPLKRLVRHGQLGKKKENDGGSLCIRHSASSLILTSQATCCWIFINN